MRVLLIAILVVLLMATVVSANSSYSYSITHDIELQLSGDFSFNSNVATPAQGVVDITLEGVGDAYLKSQLAIMEVDKASSNWFDLF